MKAQLAQTIRAAIRPAVEAFADQLVELLASQVNASYETARAAAIEILRSGLAAPATEAAPKPRKRRIAAKGAAQPPAPKRRTKRARNRLARKGQTSDIPAREETTESKSVVDPSPVPEADYSSSGAPRASGNGGFSSSRADRFALIEASASARKGGA